MAQQISVSTECDLDSEGEHRPGKSVRFWDSEGREHEIDVCEEHEVDLKEALDALDDFTQHARRLGQPASKAAGKRGKAGPDPKLVRAWAAEQSIEVNTRGRIPVEVVEQYLAASS